MVLNRLIKLPPIAYFAHITAAKLILWCYLIWYLITVSHYFDPSPSIWLNSLGISLVIGFALLLSVSDTNVKLHIKSQPRWQTARLFIMPFGVSSFSSLIKGQGFTLIAPPRISELLLSVGICLVFVCLVLVIKMIDRIMTSSQ